MRHMQEVSLTEEAELENSIGTPDCHNVSEIGLASLVI